MALAALCFSNHTGQNVDARIGEVLQVCEEQQEYLGSIAVVIKGPHQGVHASGDPNSKIFTAVLPEAPCWLRLPCSTMGRNVAFTHVCVSSMTALMMNERPILR
jgi:hypothetical protein